MIARRIIVTGDVQGVSYRYFARNEAKKLGLSGWAKNEHDGSVNIFVQGDEEKVSELIDWTQKGSPMAAVEKVEIIQEEAVERLKGFEVK